MAEPTSPFAIPRYRNFWLARFTSVIAQMGMVVVIGWQVYDIARQTMTPQEAAFQLGLIGVAQFLPLLILTPVAGWAADNFDRRLVTAGSVLLECGCAIALALLSWYHAVTLPHIFAIASLLGVARAFAGSAGQALASNLIPHALLPKAIALGSIAWQSGSVIGPPLGGYLYAIGPSAPYIASAALLLFAAVMLIRIGPIPPRLTAGNRASPIAQSIEGFRYIRQNKLVLGAISLDLFAVLLGGATAMLPIFARDILHVGAEGLGHLRAAPALGSAATALWLARHPLKTHVGRKLLIAVGVFGLATAVFGLSQSMLLSLVCLAILGAADMVSVFVRISLVQIHTPDEMRGRVGAASTLFISGSNELGEAESGFLAALVGPVAAVVAGGIGALGIALLWAKFFPALRDAHDFHVPHDPPAKEKIA